MKTHFLLLTLHLLGAAVWTGGHLVLAVSVLPRVLKTRSPEELLRFESAYEKIGIPALAIQVVTGLWLSYRLVPDPVAWFSAKNGVTQAISLKLALLLVTALFALDARLRIIPRLDETRLVALAWHIVPVTIISVLFVIVGLSFRFGGM